MEERMFFTLLNAVILLIILVIQAMLPYVSRRNILLGIRLPQEALESKEVKEIIRGFVVTNIVLGLISMVLLSFALYCFYSVRLMTLAPLLFLGILFAIYLAWNRKLKVLKEEKEWHKLATNVRVVDTRFSRDKSGSNELSKWWVLLPLLMILFNLILTFVKYPSLPEEIPSHWNFKGEIDAYMNKSPLTVLMMPAFQLGMAVVMYLAYYSMKRSKQDIDSGNPELSLRKNLIFRRVWGIYFLATTVLLELLFTFLNMMILGFVVNIKLFNIANILVTGLMIGGTIILSLVLGQGGDRMRIHGQDARAQFDMDDDRFWKLGNTVYYNPEDPAIFVEKRVGVGWTVNGGRSLGLLVLILPLIILGVTILLVK